MEVFVLPSCCGIWILVLTAIADVTGVKVLMNSTEIVYVKLPF